jgi:hypothetical protein
MGLGLTAYGTWDRARLTARADMFGVDILISFFFFFPFFFFLVKT